MNPRIFISYARRDGKPIADELREKLTKKGLSVYRDLEDIPTGSADWWREITRAIDTVEHVLLVITEAALASEIVRKEWRYARQQGRNVIPVTEKGLDGLDLSQLAGWMRRADFVNLQVEERVKRLLHDLEKSPDIRRVPLVAQQLPSDFVPRPKEFDALKKAILQGGEPVAITAALKGAGGYGKTTLAKALCTDEDIRDAYVDGILWVTLGEDAGDLKLHLDDLIKKLTGSHSGDHTLGAMEATFEELLADRCLLIVIDDLWLASDAKPFLRGGDTCARLITTRNTDTLPRDATATLVDAMAMTEATSLLATGFEDADPEKLKSLATRMGEWALLLKLANRFVLHQIKRGRSTDAALDYADNALTRRGLEAFDARKPEAREDAVKKTIGVSLDLLEAHERDRYLDLGIFPEDFDIPIATIKRLWAATSDMDDFDSEELLARLHDLSLLHGLDLALERVRVHDVFRVYLVAQAGLRGIRHRETKLVESYGRSCGGEWHDGPDDGFFFQNLPTLLFKYDLRAFDELLRDTRWLQKKLEICGVVAVIGDYPANDKALAPIVGALTLSAHVLVKDPDQLLGQMAGRLDCHQINVQACNIKAQTNWRIIPRFCCLTRPGGPLLRTLEGHEKAVNAVTVFAGDRRCVSASDDQTLRVWDLADGVLKVTLDGHEGPVRAVSVFPDGRRCVSASDDRTLKVWELELGCLEATLDGHEAPVNAVAVLADGRRCVSASDDCTLKVWDLESKSLQATLAGHEGAVLAVSILPDGQRCVSASKDRTLKVWDLESGRLDVTLEGHEGSVLSVSVCRDGWRFVSASDDQVLKVWDVKGCRLEATLEGHKDWIRAVSVLSCDRRCVSAGYDRGVKIWNLEHGRLEATLAGHQGAVLAVSACTDGRRCVSASSDRTLKVWDLDSGCSDSRLERHDEAVLAISVFPDGMRCVSASSDRTLKVWDLDSGRLEATLDREEDWARAVSTFTDGRRCILASVDRCLNIWDVEHRRLDAVIQGHQGAVLAVAVFSDGRRCVSASDDRTLKVWDLDTGRLEATLLGHEGAVLAVAVFSDGRRCVSASDDQTLKVWDLENFSLASTLVGHEGLVNAVSVFSDGRRCLSASYDRTLKVWDLESGRLEATFTADAAMICCAVISETRFVGGDAGGNLHFLELSQVDSPNPSS